MRYVILVMTVVLGIIGTGYASEQETKVPEPHLTFLAVVVDDSGGGNGNGVLEPGEQAQLEVHIYNSGTGTAAGMNGTLFTDEIDVTITDRMASFGDLMPNSVAISQSPHFSVSIASTVPCGKKLSFTLQLAGTVAIETLFFHFTMTSTAERDLARFEEEMVIYGPDNTDYTGDAIASGDINGDGYDDVVTGASYADGPGNGITNAGEVWIVYGSFSNTSQIDLATSPSNTTVIYGAYSYSYAGESVAVGDINGDGYGDVVFGEFNMDGPGGDQEVGAVWIIYGMNPMPSVIDLSSPPSYSTLIYGVDEDDQAGRNVATGDINGDGFDDILIGVRYGDGPRNSKSDTGEVWIILGGYALPPGDDYIDLASPPDYCSVIYGVDIDDQLGNPVRAGDINGDGYEDVLMGAYRGDGPGNSRYNTGEVWVRYGSEILEPIIDLATGPENTVAIYGRDYSDCTGLGLTAADFNGDGFDDIVIGVIGGGGPDNLRTSAGEVWIVNGSESIPAQIDLAASPADSTVIFGADQSDLFGYDLAAADINADGLLDLIVGAKGGAGPLNIRTNAGEGWIIYNSALMNSAIDLAFPPTNSMVIYGPDNVDLYGEHVGSGDINGDGFYDIIMGASGGDGPNNLRPSSGEVAVIYGRPTTHYIIEFDSFSWIDATTGTDIGLTCDSCCQEVSIGFDFDYYGRTYNSLWVCDDGYISFSPVEAPNPWNYCYPDRHLPNNIVAIFWDDLNGAGADGIYALLEGSPPNQRLTIQWDGIPYYPSTGDATFEMTLFEGSNQILFQYLDTIFGNGADNGGTATAGVENATGADAMPYICYSPYLLDYDAWRVIPFSSYQIFFDDMEGGINGWTTSGSPEDLWHQETSSCDPFYQSPSASWYYGQSAICDFDTATINDGLLTSPTLDSDFYSYLHYWSRREATEEHISRVQVSLDGGSMQNIDWVFDTSGEWKPAAIDIIYQSHHELNVGFSFESVGLNNGYLGWMIDNVEVWGCDVYGSKAMKAYAYVIPSPVCETSSFLLDGTGSYALGCSDVSYQWLEDGSPISGATTLQFAIPSGHETGNYYYSLELTCNSTSQTDTSDPQFVQVVPMPSEVPEDSFMLTKTGTGTSIHMIWSNIAGGDIYTLYQDTDPAGTFVTSVEQTNSGTSGIDINMPQETLVCYLVAGANDTCGEGPKR